MMSKSTPSMIERYRVQAGAKVHLRDCDPDETGPYQHKDDEQRERLQARLDDPTKQWKFDIGDLKDRAFWDDYMAAYEDALSKCSTAVAPWFVVPANHKWYRNVVVARIIVETLEGLDLRYPGPAPGLDRVVIDN